MSFVVSLRDVMTFVIALASFFAALLFLARPGLHAMRDMREIREALIGEPAQPELGRPERPGLFVSVTDLRGTVAELSATLEVVRHEVETNGGGSLKDAVKALQTDVTALRSATVIVKTPN